MRTFERPFPWGLKAGWLMLIFLLIQLGLEFSADAQCIRIRDRRRNNAWTFKPKKDFRCLSVGQSPITPFTITFQSPVSNVTINWGDTIVNYPGPISTATRIYKTNGIFNYVITQAGCAEPIRGIFVNDYNTTCPGVGWIAPPNDSSRCLPDSIRIRNLSPGMNGFTEWIINWGDQRRDTADYPSYDKYYTHKYKAGEKLCNPLISISYRNTCNIVPCGQALGTTFGPFRFMEKDSAKLNIDTVFICTPTSITVRDISVMNCRDTAKRQISWTALDGFNSPLPNPGNGIWRPRGPVGNQRITIPASMFSVVPPEGKFKLRMQIRNKCGEDTAELTIVLVNPASPSFQIGNPGACAGAPVQFSNTTPNPHRLNYYVWDFGDGSTDSSNLPNPSHSYLGGGNYSVKLKVITRGYEGQICIRETTMNLLIRDAVVPGIKISPSNSGCSPLTAIVKNKSRFPANANWIGWSLGGSPVVAAGNNHFPGPNSSDPGQIQVLNTSPADSSATLRFLNYGLYPLTLIAQSPGCDENAGTDTIRVYPKPKLRWRINRTTFCRGEFFEIRDSSRIMETDEKGLGSDFNNITWSLKIGNDTILNSSSPITGDFDSPALTNRISVCSFKNAGTFWVKLTVRGKGGCAISDSIQMVVRQSAVPRFSSQATACNNSSLILKNNTLENANRFVYRIYQGNSIVPGQEFATFTRTDNQDQPIFLPYTPPGDSTTYMIVLTAVTISGSDSCVLQSMPRMVRVGPTPIPDFQINPGLDGCSPLSNLSILNTSKNIPSTGSVMYNWNFGPAGTFQGQNPPQVSFVNSGLVNRKDTVRLCLQTPNGCSYCTEKVVVTYPLPRAVINIPDSICSGISVPVSATTTGAVYYQWKFSDYDGTTYTDPSFTKTFNNLSGAPTTFNVSLLVKSQSGCSLTVTKALKVNPNPEFNFQTITRQDANCGPLQAKFYFLNTQSGYRYVWNFGNGDTLQTFLTDTLYKAYENETAAPYPNTVTVKAVSPVGCSTTRISSFTVNPLVRARFSISTDSGCTPLRVTLSDSSTMASNIRQWMVNNTVLGNQQGLIAHNFYNIGQNDTTYTIRLAVKNNQGFNCVDTMSKTIRVFPKPKANMLLANPAEGCSPLTVQFQGNVQNAVSYFWDFNDGTDTTVTGQSLSRILYNSHPVNNRIHRVKRISISEQGCRDTTEKVITVKPFTKAVISVIQTSGCSPFTAQFSALNSVNANAYEWNFGNGTPTNTSPAPNATFTNNSDTIRTFRIRLIARKTQTNFCPDTAYATISVFPAPPSGFTANTLAGCGPLPLILTDTAATGLNSFWVLSSGGISDTLFPNQEGKADTIIENPNFASKMLWVDQHVVSSLGCISRKSLSVQVYPNLTAEFDIDSSGCHPHVVRFKNLSENYGGSYRWDFGDGTFSTEKNPTRIFDNNTLQDKIFSITLTSKGPFGNCTKTKTAQIRVHPSPAASFRFLSDSTIQLPLKTVTIGNNTPFRNNWTYSWTFDDGSTDTNGTAEFVHGFMLDNDDFIDTTFTITMVARSSIGCADTMKRVMVIKPGKPLASFEASTREGCRPLEVQLTSTSLYAGRYEWTYVDKEGSPPVVLKERNPVIYFESAGLKTIKLKAKGSQGQDSIEKTNYIQVFETPRSSFTVDPAPPRTVIALDEPAYFFPNDNRAEFSYTWYFGDGDSSNSRTPIHKYPAPGVYDVSLKVTGPNGCQSTSSRNGAVIARPDQLFAAPNAFTPNPFGSNGGVVGGDGDNDIFYPFAKGLKEIKMTIYNRWGQVIFHSRELNRGWDGYYQGKLMPTDTYIYQIQAQYTNGETQNFIGDITLLR
jgi:gliding motility-associated-like protein